MTERGQPLITPARSAGSESPTPGARKQTLILLSLIYLSPLLAILIIALIAGVVRLALEPSFVPTNPSTAFSEPHAIVRAPIVKAASSAPYDDAEQHFRAFTSKNSTQAVVLAHGEYSLDVVESDREIILRATPSLDSVFIADFSNGVSYGDISTATLILILGNVDLTVGDIGKVDKFTAKLRIHKKRVQAHMDYSRTERGPPTYGIKKEIVIIGEIENFNMPGSHGRAQSDIRIEALDDEYWRNQKAPKFEPFQSWVEAHSEPKRLQPYELLLREQNRNREAERHGRK